MNPIRRPGALVASLALAVSGVALTSSPAQAASPDPRPQAIAADWVAGQLVDGLMPSQFAGFPDYGLTIDTGLGLIAAGGHATTVSDISDALAPKVADGYAEADEYSYPANQFVQKGIYAGSVAKSLVYANAAGIADPQAWSGADLLADLEGRVSGTAPIVGRIVDDSSFGDYANVFGQAFAANALAEASSPKAADALAFLLKQQCAAGYFRLFFAADKAATDQTCDGGKAAGESAADPDATALVIRLLLPQLDNAAVARAVGKAEGWLLAQQRADGSFIGGTSTAVPNTNSTGLAGWALGELGDTEAATRAAAWIRGRQADELAGCANGLTPATGAVGYDSAAVTAATKSGITSGAAPQWRRSTAAVVPALHWAPTGAGDLAATGPLGYLHAGRAVSIRVAGALPGGKFCLTGSGAPVRATVDTDGKATITPTLPAGTANRTLTVTDRDGNADTVVTKVLGTKTLTVAGATRVTRNKTVRITVSGLAAGEAVTLRLRGATVATGKATAAGTFVRIVKVGARLGRAAVAASGQFADIRHGSKVIRVVR